MANIASADIGGKAFRVGGATDMHDALGDASIHLCSSSNEAGGRPTSRKYTSVPSSGRPPDGVGADELQRRGVHGHGGTSRGVGPTRNLQVTSSTAHSGGGIRQLAPM